MQLRPLRTAALAGLAVTLALAACTQDPNTHATFTAVTRTPARDAATSDTGPGGSSGAGGSSNVDAGPRTDGKTSGCGMDPNQPVETYTEYHIQVAGPDLDANMQPKVRDRTYFVRLPSNYDQNAPNRVVYLGPGCGGSTASEVIRLYSASVDDAILVAIMPLPEFGSCFDETVTSVEYPFFDAVHKKIESSFCVDTAHQFYAGFSTGARLGYMLDCAFPDVLRATGTIQGGLPAFPACKSHPIAGFFVADTLETGNPYQENVMAAERLITQNGCTGGKAMVPFNPMTAAPLPPTTACVKYSGCPANYPIVFCTTMGQGHMTFEPWSDQAFWNFFKSF